MSRLLRVYLWLRWRVFVNGVKSGWRRDAFEGITRTAGLVMVAFLGILLAGSIFMTGWLSRGAGQQLVAGGSGAEFVVFILRLCLLIFFGTMVILVPVGQSQAGPGVRPEALRLLPIPRQLLHASEIASWFGNPFVLLIATVAIAIPWGMAGTGETAAAAGALVAGIALVLLSISFGSLLSQGCQWLMRDRGRAEWTALGLMIGILLLSVLAPLIGEGREAAEETPAGSGTGMPADLPFWLIIFPSDLYARSVAAAADGLPARAILFSGLLIAQAGLLFAFSSRVHRMLLESPPGGRARRTNGRFSLWPQRLPGVPQRVGAVALAHARAALRSVRGKLAVYFSGPFLFAIVLVLRSAPEERFMGGIFSHSGPALFGTGVVFVLLSIHPIVLNQFGVDGKGAALQFLSPLSNRDLLHGKALGGALLFLMGVALCLPPAVALFPATNPWLWVAVLAGAPSTYLLAAPAFAFASISFPRRSDLGKIGPASEAHGMARILGLFVTVVASAPASLFVMVFGIVKGREAIAAFFCIAWTVLCAPVSLALLNALQSLAEERRENILLVAREQ